MSGLRKDVDTLLRKLTSAECGCVVQKGNTKYWKVSRPGHRMITISRTPSDQRAMRNILRDVRLHLGLDLKNM